VNNEYKWIIVLVAYDDPEIRTRVFKERLRVDEDEELAAFLRGGELMAVIGADDEILAESQRQDIERTCLR
jgi:hypothetical protein